MMSRYSDIPERVFSLFVIQVKEKLTEIRKRKLSAISTKSTSSTVSEFLDAKIHEFELNQKYTQQSGKVLKKACDAKIFTEKN